MKINKKYAAALSAGAFLFFFLAFAISHKNNTLKEMAALQNERTEAVLRNLKKLNEEIVEARSGSQRNQNEALRNMESSLRVLQKSIIELAKTSDLQKVSNEILSIKTDMSSQINDLKQTVLDGKAEKNYLRADALPFHVMSIDVIAGRVYVSVDYDHRILPLGVGDFLAGWRLNNASYDTSKAEFVNEKNQFVMVNLQSH